MLSMVPMVPAEVGYNIAKRQAAGEGVSAWDLLILLVEYIQGQLTDVVALVQPAINSAPFATAGGTRSKSLGAIKLPAVVNPSPAQRKFMSQRLEATLGHCHKELPRVTQPSGFNQQTIKLVA